MIAEYLSTNSFRVAGNKVEDFSSGRRVKLDCGIDGIFYSTVTYSSISGVYTVVYIDEEILTSTLAEVYYSVISAGAFGGLPEHTHSLSEGQGGQINFKNLADVPTTYSGASGKVLMVNSSENGLVFSSSTTSTALTIELLVVAGGGAGGGGEASGDGDGAGGGGGGGVYYNEYFMITPTVVYNIAIGSGAPATTIAYTPGNNGSDSSFGSIITKGGGGGGGDVGPAAINNKGSIGGNGGGAASLHVTTTYGGESYYKGFPGGNSYYNYRGGAGGGGAGSPGEHVAFVGNGGCGGQGFIHPILGSFGGGGGGGACGGLVVGYGGTGGGGAGGNSSVSSTPGSTNTGGGGGGGAGATSYFQGGSGGSGIVIIRYSTSIPAAITTGSPIYTISSEYRIYKFFSDGSFSISI